MVQQWRIVVWLGRKVGQFLRLDGADRLLLVEAVLLLALSRLALLALPFRRIIPWLERMPDSPDADAATILAVRRAVLRAARHVPWNAVCLPQAMACKAMLARRGQGSALHIGAAMTDRKELMAHAWLVAGGMVVVGEEAVGNVAPLARFG
jgi:hypothetical protein